MLEYGRTVATAGDTQTGSVLLVERPDSPQFLVAERESRSYDLPEMRFRTWIWGAARPSAGVGLQPVEEMRSQVIIWRGWGILPVLYTLGAFVLVMVSGDLPFAMGTGLAVAALATWFTGVALNRTLPEKKVDRWATERKNELNTYVANGTFSLGPGHPLPANTDVARQMADSLLESETTTAHRELSNNHTLFWIPLQYMAVVLSILAIVSVVSDFTRSAT